MPDKTEISFAIIYFQTVGIIYSVSLFGGFGLNFADYAEIDDFIFASFKEPILFIMSIVIVMCSLYVSRRRNQIVALAIPVITAAFFGFLTSYLVINCQKSMLLSNTGALVEVHFIPDTVETLEGDDDRFESVYMIASAGDLFFFFDRFLHKEAGCVNSTIIIPRNNITRIARVPNVVDSLRKRSVCQSSIENSGNSDITSPN